MNIPPGFAQVNVFWGGLAMPRGAQTVFGIQPIGNNVGQPPSLLANAVYLAVSSKIMPETHNTLRLLRVLAKMGPNETGPAGEFGAGINGAGNNTPDSPQVAALVKKITAGGGRQSRGRMFLPVVAESQTDAGGLLTEVTRNALQNAMNAFLTDLTIREVPMVLLHNAVEIVPTPVTALTLDVRVATQRRRLRKVGGRRKVIQ